MLFNELVPLFLLLNFPFLLPSLFQLSTTRTNFDFFGAVHCRADDFSEITLQHRICNPARWLLSLHNTESLVVKFAGRERVSLMDQSIMRALYTLNRSFVGLLHFAGTVVEVPTHKTQFHLFDLSQHTLEIDQLAANDRMDSCINIYSAWFFHACQASRPITATFSSSHAERTSC